MQVKPLLVWVMLLVMFDSAGCAALRAVLDPLPALTMEDANPATRQDSLEVTPTPCEQVVAARIQARSASDRKAATDALCRTPSDDS